MKENKNIDRLFQESLKDFEVFPPNKSWNSIEKRLAPSKGKRTSVWKKVATIAAFFVLFFSVSTYYLVPESTFSESFLTKNQKKQDTADKTDSLNVDVKKSNLSESKQNTTSKNIQNAPVEENVLVANENSSEKENSQNNDYNNLIDKKSFASNTNLSLKNTPSKTNNTIKENTQSKFTIATIFAPIYFSSFGDGSGIDSQFKDNQTSGTTSYSYGVKFAYKLNNKFSLQSGVNLINLGYKTNNVYVTPGVSIVDYSNLSSIPYASKGESLTSTKETSTASLDQNVGSLNQVFGYIEIPIEIKYNVADGKIGVNLVGGFSTLLLNRDEVFIETNSFTQSLGASNNLRSINFSGNIGLDVDYLIKKNLYINVSPMFKIQTNTFSKNSGSFQPYYLGVYTGLNYKF
ncbi:hypothetical protein [Lutibacter sp.]